MRFPVAPAAGWLLANGASASDSSGIEFFEKKIRPLLVRILQVPSAEARRSKAVCCWIRARDAQRRRYRPRYCSREPEKSLFIKAIRYTDETCKCRRRTRTFGGTDATWKLVKMGRRSPIGKLETELEIELKSLGFQPIKEPRCPREEQTMGAVACRCVHPGRRKRTS